MGGRVQTAWTTEGVTAQVGEFFGIRYAQTPKRFEVAKLSESKWTVRTRCPCVRKPITRHGAGWARRWSHASMLAP